MLRDFIDKLNEVPVLKETLLGNSLADYLVSLVIFLLACLGILLVKRWLVGQLESLSKGQNGLDDLLLNLLRVISLPFYLAISLYIATRYLALSSEVDTALTVGVTVVGYVYLTLGLQRAIESLLEVFTADAKDKKSKRRLDRTTTDFLKRFVVGAVWLVMLLMALRNFGYDITTLLGGLGIAGIAIAFALQNVLADIFAYFTINLDKPFRKGDFISLGEDKGTVKHIGLKNTRIKTLRGENLIVNNRELTDSRLNNFATMERRRVVIHLPVEYSTSDEKLAKIPALVEEVIGQKEECTFGRAHLKEFGEYSFVFEVVYHVESPGHDLYMNVNQDILLGILRQFKSHKIQLAHFTKEMGFVGTKKSAD